jgi:ABC-type polysaccharide/polyol phosphate export permease
MQLGFFVTPIIYSVDRVDSRALRTVLRLNPMTPFVIAYQDIFFFGRLPSTSDTILILAYSFVSLLAGFFIFDRLRDTLAEAI